MWPIGPTHPPAAAQRHVGAAVEAPADPKLDRGGQQALYDLIQGEAQDLQREEREEREEGKERKGKDQGVVEEYFTMVGDWQAGSQADKPSKHISRVLLSLPPPLLLLLLPRCPAHAP